MTQKDICDNLRADLVSARKALIKALAADDATAYFDAQAQIKEISTMLKIATD